MATIAVYRGDQFLRLVELGEAPTRIGRAPENELVLEDRDKGVSRTHAEIRYERGRYVVVDLNSQNGVWIGDWRVKLDPLPLDVPVTIGPYRLVLVPDPEAAPTAEISAGPLVDPNGEERFAEPTELVQPEGQVARTQVLTAPAPWLQKRGLVAALAIVVVMIAGLVVATIVRRSPAPPTGQADIAKPEPPPPTAEERFQVQYGKAQGYIEKGDKASALAENTEALKVLPEDPRGLKQRADIDAMSEPPTPLVDPPLVPEVAAPPPAPAGGVTNLPLAPTLKVPLRSGEPSSDRAARERLAKSQLDEGKKLLDDHRYAEAIEKLQSALDTSGRPDYGYTANEVGNLLQKASAAQAGVDNTQKRVTAQKLVAEAKALQGSDLAAAIKRLLQARNLDPQATGVTEILATFQDQARSQGEAALSSAKNLDIDDKRPEQALKEFEKAAQLLELAPGVHPGLAHARRRIAELKSGR